MTTQQKLLERLTEVMCKIADQASHVDDLMDRRDQLADEIVQARRDLRQLFDERENLEKALRST